jgi:hypothetical protein
MAGGKNVCVWRRQARPNGHLLMPEVWALVHLNNVTLRQGKKQTAR